MILLIFSGLVPDKYIIYAGVALSVALILTSFLSWFRNTTMKVIAVIISCVVILVNGFGIYSLAKASDFINSLSGVEYEIDNMIVVVRADDSAQEIGDTADYIFGYQSTTDIENTQTMIEEIETQLGTEIELMEYSSIIDLANALLDGEIHAAIYNEVFDLVIDENVENYMDSVKIIYRHEIIVQTTPTPTPTPTPNSDTDELVEDNDDCFTMYLSGIDISGSLSLKSRSDVNIIMTVNTTTKKILLTTTPRDTYVYIPEVSGNTMDKLTHAGLYGVETSMATLEQLYGIEIDYYARVNFTSFEEIIDSIGGIEVESDYSFESDGYYFSKGTNTLTGAQALAFARNRSSFTTGDIQRGINQQAVVTGIINKLLEPSVLLNFNSILESISDSMQTDMPYDEIAELVKMQLEDGSSWEIESVNLTGTGSSQYCYSLGSNAYVMYVDEDSLAEIVAKMEAVLSGE